MSAFNRTFQSCETKLAPSTNVDPVPSDHPSLHNTSQRSASYSHCPPAMNKMTDQYVMCDSYNCNYVENSTPYSSVDSRSCLTTHQQQHHYRLPIGHVFYLVKLARTHHPDFFCLLAMAQVHDPSFQMPHEAVKDYRIHPQTCEYLDAPNPLSIRDYWGDIDQDLIDLAVVDPRAFHYLIAQHEMFNPANQRYYAIMSRGGHQQQLQQNCDSRFPSSSGSRTCCLLPDVNTPKSSERDPLDLSDILMALPQSPTSTLQVPMAVPSSFDDGINHDLKSATILPLLPAGKSEAEPAVLSCPSSMLEPEPMNE